MARNIYLFRGYVCIYVSFADGQQMKSVTEGITPATRPRLNDQIYHIIQYGQPRFYNHDKLFSGLVHVKYTIPVLLDYYNWIEYPIR